jgi:hypothetical protein
MTMPDNSFHELLRSIFGKIKTPYNKQQLLKDLERFLLREDIQKTIASYIDVNDAKVIAAVSFFDEPFSEELKRFFNDEFSHMQLHDIIVNLEERFILYRYEDKELKTFGMSRLALNPVLEKILAPFAENVSILFPAETENSKKTDKNTLAINDLILAGLLSFTAQWQIIYKTEGILRKQVIDAGKICFPGMDLKQILGALQILGLFFENDSKLLPDLKRFSDITLLSFRERMEYCAAALIVYKEANNPVNIQAPYYKNRIKEASSFIHAFLDTLALIYANTENPKNITEKALVRLALILKSRIKSVINIDYLMDALAKTNLVSQIICTTNTVNSNAPISIDSGSSIFVYPEISFSDAVELASFTNIKEASAVVRFELEKNAAARAFNNDISSQKIIDTLNRLSGKKIPDNIAWNLTDWEKRHSEVSLKKGVVLTLAKDKQYLVKTMPLSAMINETLVPGVYLLNEDAEEEAASALNNAGIDIMARDKNTNRQDKAATLTQNYFPAQSSLDSLFSKIQKTQDVIKKDDSAALINNFQSILGKMPLNKSSRDELSARIDRRLILCEAQLNEANIRYEKLEARHMDYAGKQIIAKQAVAQMSPVEIIWQNGKQIYGIPAAMEKKDDELVLVVVPGGKNEELRIPLAKISLLRRIKKSIFDN